MKKEMIFERITKLLSQPEFYLFSKCTPLELEKLLYGTISIVKTCYGENSKQFDVLSEAKKMQSSTSYEKYKSYVILNALGILENLKSDIELGLLVSIEQQTTGDIFTDFLTISKKLLNEGHKEAASVLVCGAFEDVFKKIGSQNGLEVYDAELSNVINGLKSKSVIQGPQAKVAQSHIQLRNKSFHAQWDKIDIPEIKGLIVFLEEMIIKHFYNDL